MTGNEPDHEAGQASRGRRAYPYHDMHRGALHWVGCANCGCPVNASVPVNRFAVDILSCIDEALQKADNEEVREAISWLATSCWEDILATQWDAFGMTKLRDLENRPKRSI